MSQALRFNVDALSLTFHALNLDELQTFCERHLFQRSPFDQAMSWERMNLEGGRTFLQRSTYGGGDVVIMAARSYCCLQLKSRACELLQDNLPMFAFEVLHHAGRTNATRIDAAWSHVPFTPPEFFAALKSKQLVSSQSRKVPGWYVDEGQTAAFPSYADRKDVPRMVRCYDRRGFDRLELELHNPDANDAFRRMAITEPPEWSRLFLRYLLRCCDFREPGNTRTNNRKRCGWWSDFLGGVVKLDKLEVIDPPAVVRPELARAHAWFSRNAVQLGVMVDAMGWPWVMQQLAFRQTLGKLPPAARVEALKAETTHRPPPPPEAPPSDPEALPF